MTFLSNGLTLSIQSVINLKFPQQPHQKCYTTQYGELEFNPFTSKLKKFILPTFQRENVYVMYWELAV